MKLTDLYAAGTSAWLDDLSRAALTTTLPERIARKEVFGVTTNPAIFQAAITKDESYKSAIAASKSLSAEEIVEKLTTEDVRDACKLFRPIFDATNGVDGRVSIEVDPRLAHQTAETVAQAKRLWSIIDQPNLMIKIPATKAGLPAITEVIAAGISVNVTLIFSLTRYAEVIDAYQAGIEKCSNPKNVHSVASFFVSRVDSAVDKLLTDDSLKGKAAIANARLAYELYLEKFKNFPHNHQRPLWASTGVKDPVYRSTMYVDSLIAPNTVNTMPPATLDAVISAVIEAEDTITPNIQSAKEELLALAALGIDLNKITDELEADGVDKFMTSWDVLLGAVEAEIQKAK
ncbi:MAG: transaldolase [Candidatus Nanopelagicaceae bacterium]|nr:transaldolase [Candidatus Nanopelagicaceae bacterium]